MSESPLIVRFTDEKYSTRLETSIALNTNLIDPIWAEIVKYRNTMKHIINVLDITSQPHFITYTNKVTAKNSANTALFERFNDDIGNIVGGSSSTSSLLDSIEEESINLMKRISENYTENYKKALNDLDLDTSSFIDEEFLAKYLFILNGTSEISSFYRDQDIQSESSKYLISREYEAAPVNMIEILMNNLFTYLADYQETITNKIIVTVYMFDFVKPFTKFNEEMCAIVLKKIINLSLHDNKGNFFAIENVLLNKELLKKYKKEIQKTRDLTYLFIPLSNVIEETVTKTLDKLVNYNVKSVRDAYLLGDNPEQIKKEFGIEVEKPVVEETPVQETIKEEAAIKEEITKPLIKENKPIKEVDGLSDKELKKMENSMLEADPYLKKCQAHFYVRHHEVGKYYTIQQYKKEERVVYETARTSMDNLAKLGYYRREQIKNKFVYTPIQK